MIGIMAARAGETGILCSRKMGEARRCDVMSLLWRIHGNDAPFHAIGAAKHLALMPMF